MINWQKLDVEKRKGVDENKEKAQAFYWVCASASGTAGGSRCYMVSQGLQKATHHLASPSTYKDRLA